ncbi:DUF2461 domain-containing protein [Flavobacterium aurantiibacter]|uniref:TIGR02453 family protein n=1 Tax=Flavobacterium aurantiibacter TaxID=2023067 RepID=A0A255ZDC8_9FLAO|nr:DUF2461 domain-containing protein [Flavobacterium aurantiibacter]OYQ38600.1 hypothetical protein CHX27_14520 [Flavobacterium aurantiibacter]
MIQQEAIAFLKDLAENNNRDWFQSKQDSYQKYRKHYLELAQELLSGVQEFDLGMADVEAKKVVFRINRDIRFSKDKSPYKTHMGFWISPAHANNPKAGYYLHVDPKGSFLAGGIYMPEAKDLKKIRTEIAFFYDDLQEILSEKKFKTAFDDLQRDEHTLKTAPKDFEKDHPAIKHLQLKSFIVQRDIPFDDLFKSNFISDVVANFKIIKPLNDFLNRAFDVAD